VKLVPPSWPAKVTVEDAITYVSTYVRSVPGSFAACAAPGCIAFARNDIPSFVLPLDAAHAIVGGIRERLTPERGEKQSDASGVSVEFDSLAIRVPDRTPFHLSLVDAESFANGLQVLIMEASE
jgi:hypothetical protein